MIKTNIMVLVDLIWNEWYDSSYSEMFSEYLNNYGIGVCCTKPEGYEVVNNYKYLTGSYVLQGVVVHTQPVYHLKRIQIFIGVNQVWTQLLKNLRLTKSNRSVIIGLSVKKLHKRTIIMLDTLKTRLSEVLSDITSRSFGSRLKQYPMLLQEISEATKQYNPKNISEQVFIILKGPPTLKECGKYPLFNTFEKGYRQFCGPHRKCECSTKAQSETIARLQSQVTLEERAARQAKQKDTAMERYGVENPAQAAHVKEKMTKTNMERYGARTPFESSVIQDKVKQTCLDRYGVEKPLQSQIIQEKGRATTIERHGGLMIHAREGAYKKYDGKNPFTDADVKAKIAKTNLERYGKASPKHFHLTDDQLDVLKTRERFEKLIDGKTATSAAYELGVNTTTISRYSDYYDLDHLFVYTDSINEVKMNQILTPLNVKVIQNSKKIIAPNQIDFYLPDHNVAFEVGAIFRHSELNSNGKRGKWYHWSKWNDCRQLGFHLYQWFDDEIIASLPVIENKVRYLTNNIANSIGARKIQISNNIPVSDERDFLNQNHIQRFSTNRTHVFGGYYDGELVAIMTFRCLKNARHNILTRYATKLNSTYPGLFSKMIKFALSSLPKNSIISYSDNRHSDGAVYEKSGFRFSHAIGPNYFYTKNYHTRLNKEQFMTHKLKEQYPDLEGETEWEMMQELGYDRIWDAGKKAWVMDFN